MSGVVFQPAQSLRAIARCCETCGTDIRNAHATIVIDGKPYLTSQPADYCPKCRAIVCRVEVAP